jgi:hypothetical protein
LAILNLNGSDIDSVIVGGIINVTPYGGLLYSVNTNGSIGGSQIKVKSSSSSLSLFSSSFSPSTSSSSSSSFSSSSSSFSSSSSSSYSSSTHFQGVNPTPTPLYTNSYYLNSLQTAYRSFNDPKLLISGPLGVVSENDMDLGIIARDNFTFSLQDFEG